MRIYLSFLFTVFSTAIFCQQLPPPFTVDSTFSKTTVVGSRFLQYRQGSSDSLLLQLQTGKTGCCWKDMPVQLLTDFRVHEYWFRYRLKNEGVVEQKIALLNSNEADKSEYYIFSNGQADSSYITGNLVPWNEKNGLKKENVIVTTLPAGKTIDVYNHITNHYFISKPVSLSVSIAPTQQVIATGYIGNQPAFSENDFDYLFVGLLLFACFFSFFVYFIVRDKVYLYYALFLFYFLFRPTPFVTVIFPDHPLVLTLFLLFLKGFGVFLFIHFSRYFLKTFNEFPQWDRFLKGVAIFDLVCQSADCFAEPYTWGSWSYVFHELSDFSFCAGLLTILITFIKYLRYKDRSIRIIEIAAIPSSIFWFVGFTIVSTYSFLQFRLHIEPPRFVTMLNIHFKNINRTVVSWMAITFSWALLVQFLELKKQKAQLLLEAERISREKEIERNQLIKQQKEELEITVRERTGELRQTIDNLKATQAQLIQAEKMASLGQLTAGIAHEIQNPLNFVNNFSEVNIELVNELIEEANKGNTDEVRLVAADIKDNSEKINHHGKRADSIVKGMLQHSRTSAGQKQATNFNALAEEYLKLAYHGFRVKDKSFNASIETELDKNIDKINIVPQDIGRVLLNVINNAFYAVTEKAKQNMPGYVPAISIRTEKTGKSVYIKITDNGNGIPQTIVDKIFQPFFTTKPTGYGTGLGLSLAYDIVKAHGGEIEVDSKQGEYSEFKVTLPY